MEDTCSMHVKEAKSIKKPQNKRLLGRPRQGII